VIRIEEIVGKSVIGSKGTYIGDVCNISIAPNDWKVTHLYIKLSGQAIKGFEVKKSLKGNVMRIPTSSIAKVDVIITLNQSLIELKENYSPVNL
jgi:sporulation protein YlmC with PRC-barrel domain